MAGSGLVGHLYGLALGLCNAGLGSHLDGGGGDGGTGHIVDLRGLLAQQLLGEGVLGGLTDVLGLTGQVQLHVGDAFGVKGHGDRDRAHAVCGGRVGAGNVGAACSLRRAGGCLRSGAAACSHTGYGGSGSGADGFAQETTARDHVVLHEKSSCVFVGPAV